MASPRIGRRRKVRPLNPEHFFARVQTRDPGKRGSSWYRTIISEKVGMIGMVTDVHRSGDDDDDDGGGAAVPGALCDRVSGLYRRRGSLETVL